jgi:hypothetical protein
MKLIASVIFVAVCLLTRVTDARTLSLGSTEGSVLECTTEYGGYMFEAVFDFVCTGCESKQGDNDPNLLSSCR